MTTALLVSLSLFVLIFAIRIWHMSGIIDDLELRILKLEKAETIWSAYQQQRLNCSRSEHSFAEFDGHTLCRFCGASKP